MEWLQLFDPEPSAGAARVDSLFWLLTALSSAVTLAIVITATVFVYRYWHQRPADRERPPAHVRRRVELTWTSLTLVAFLFLFLWGASLFAYVNMLAAPEGAIEVYALGKQWMWKIQHENGKREINTLHVPRGEPVRVILTSQDVIHSFYLPEFRAKKDAVPGLYTELWFVPERTGVYTLACSEYCGTAHARMRGRLVVLEPEDYARWLAAGEPQGLAAAGAQKFRALGCSGCHSPRSTVRAPSLAGLYGRPVPLQGGGTVRADEAYLRDSILLPRKHVVAGFAPIMPSFQGQVGEEAIIELIAYIKSLADEERIRGE